VSYDDREKSWEDGAPVEYYAFIRGTDYWRYNTSDRILTRIEGIEEVAYAPMAISRERIQQGVERNKLTLSVRVPRSAAVADLWHPYPSSAAVGLTVYGGHIGEADEIVVWIGRVVSPKFSPEDVELMGEPTTTIARKSGQVQSWQRGCMHVLYKQGDGLCNANRDDFAVPAVVTSVLANIVTAAEFAAVPNGRLAGGYVEWETVAGAIERRSINAHNGSTITLFYGSSDLQTGTNVIVYPGCKHNWDDCENFFNNGVNYGGDLYSPERSPFNGNPVF
jgi:uncharacterized phage protein (TIGR02218 family)